MSSPLEATSVASSTDRDLDLNLFSAPRRLFCPMQGREARVNNKTAKQTLQRSFALMGTLPEKLHSVCECMYFKYIITSHELLMIITVN